MTRSAIVKPTRGGLGLPSFRRMAAAATFLGTLAASTAAATMEIEVYPDTASAGWTYKTSDVAFAARFDDCEIRWNAIRSTNGEAHLEVRRRCDLSFEEQAPLHRAIADAIAARYSFREFDGLSWGPFRNGDDLSWNRPVVAAFLSDLAHPENATLRGGANVNELFVRLANETRAYGPLVDILSEHGVTLTLKSVEKVFAAPADQLPHGIADLGDGSFGDQRIPFDVGSSYFRIETRPSTLPGGHPSAGSTAGGHRPHP